MATTVNVEVGGVLILSCVLNKDKKDVMADIATYWGANYIPKSVTSALVLASDVSGKSTREDVTIRYNSQWFSISNVTDNYNTWHTLVDLKAFLEPSTDWFSLKDHVVSFKYNHDGKAEQRVALVKDVTKKGSHYTLYCVDAVKQEHRNFVTNKIDGQVVIVK